MTVPLRTRVSIHEAAHALAAMFQQSPVTRVEVDPDGAGGTTWHAPNEDPRAMMFIASAGPIAELQICGPGHMDAFSHSTDQKTALAFAHSYGGADHIAGIRMLATCRRDAEEWAAQYRDLILDLAGELNGRGYMDGPELAQWLEGRV